MNKLEALRAFCLVSEAKSFTAAARQLQISPTMVSRYIKQLEAELGCLLLKRNTRQVFLTDAGEEYHQQIVPLLKKLAQADLKMSRYNTEPRGKLTISTSIEFGSQYLAPLIATYQSQYPEVKLQFKLDNQPLDLLKDDIDLVFRIAPELPDSSFIAQPICKTRLALWASPDYLKRQSAPLSIDELATHALLFFSHSVRKDQWIFNFNGERIHQKFDWLWCSNNGRLLNEAAAQGQGIIQAPSYSVHEYARNKRLVEVMPTYSINNLSVYALYPHRLELSIRVKTFVESAKEYFTRHPID